MKSKEPEFHSREKCATMQPTMHTALPPSKHAAVPRARRMIVDSPGSPPRSAGKGEIIRFAVGPCSLGPVLVAFSEKGICFILLGDEAAELLIELQKRFPKAELIAADPSDEQLFAKVVRLVEMPGIRLDLPLDPRGTAFQQRVWQALREIPAGATASYAQIAAEIGSPKSVRAVAGACAANPIAVVIPCHRVVRKDGGLSGYRWGTLRKRALLDREAGV